MKGDVRIVTELVHNGGPNVGPENYEANEPTGSGGAYAQTVRLRPLSGRSPSMIDSSIITEWQQ